MRKYLKWLKNLTKSDWVLTLLCLFLATDIGFIILHLVHSYTALIPNTAFSLETDRGYSEILQYIKEYWAALILMSLGVRSRARILSIWSLLFFYLLLDDAAEVHEKLGFALSHYLPSFGVFNLKTQDLGEVIVFGVVGVIFLGAIAFTYRFSDRYVRNISQMLTMMLLALAFFGLVLDVLHSVFYHPDLNALFVLFEDGGELFIMSVIVCFVLSLSFEPKGSVRHQPLIHV